MMKEKLLKWLRAAGVRALKTVAQTAAATIYDMAKAVQKDMIIRDVRLLYKAGGKSGEFVAAL